MTTFHNFALKIEASWTTAVVTLIFETRDSNDVSMYGKFIILE